MSSPENEGVDLRVLTMNIPSPLDPNEFSGTFGPNKETKWTASKCASVAELFPGMPDDAAENLNSLLPDAWPAAYLIRIDTVDGRRGLGFGSSGLSEFLNQAKSRGCRMVFVWIGDESGNWDRNYKFYIQKNRWKPLFSGTTMCEVFERNEQAVAYTLIPQDRSAGVSPRPPGPPDTPGGSC